MAKWKHGCIHDAVVKQVDMTHNASKARIELWFSWPEFSRTEVDNPPDWRHFCRLVRQRAHELGMDYPPLRR